ncbi:MAG: hypothetical protein M3297_12815 [Thermoproteota archaeon]|nr:hypothetical protein [Thermoproteota archaeon]
MVTFPNVTEVQSSKDDKNRFTLSGTIDEVGSDIQLLKAMGVEHIIFNYNLTGHRLDHGILMLS